MAGGSEKKIKKDNAVTLASHGKILLAVLALFVPVRWIFMSASMSLGLWVVSGITVAAMLLSYQQLTSAANLEIDLNMAGSVLEYFKDIIYVSSAILVLSLVTNYAFLLWLPVLAFAAYKGWAFAKPWLFPPKETDTEADSKRVAKKERQAALQQRRAKNG